MPKETRDKSFKLVVPYNSLGAMSLNQTPAVPTVRPVRPVSGAVFGFSAPAPTVPAPAVPAPTVPTPAVPAPTVPTPAPVRFVPASNEPTRVNDRASLMFESALGGKTKKCKYPSTYAGLHIWFKSEFEKLGWMVLAQKKGYHDKVKVYKNSVKRLYEHLKCKVRDTKDHDRKQDLLIMCNDVKCLMEHIHKDF